MNEVFDMTLTLITGIFLGLIFFGGLWLTVQKSVSSKHSAALFLTSLLLRTGIVLAGFYFVMNGSWRKLLVCLLGFIIARLIVTGMTHPSREKQITHQKGASHAP